MEFRLAGDLSKAIKEAKNIIRRTDLPFVIRLIGVVDENIRTETSKQYCRIRWENKLNSLFAELGGVTYQSTILVISSIEPTQRECPKCMKMLRSNNMARHLKICAKKGFCRICEKEFGDVEKHMKTCSVKTYSCRVCNKHFNTGARRTAHEKRCRVVANEGGQHANHTEETALDGAFRIISIKPDTKSGDFVGVIEDEYEHIEEILMMRMSPAVKFYLSIRLKMTKMVGEGEDKIGTFNTSATLLLPEVDILPVLKSHAEILEVKVDNYLQNGSGWVVDSVDQINVMLTSYDPIN